MRPSPHISIEFRKLAVAHLAHLVGIIANQHVLSEISAKASAIYASHTDFGATLAAQARTAWVSGTGSIRDPAVGVGEPDGHAGRLGAGGHRHVALRAAAMVGQQTFELCREVLALQGFREDFQ
jgi:hypothetical protein